MLSDGGARFIDVFTANWVDGIVYMPSDTGFEIPIEDVLPLGTVSLHGHDVPAPRNPDLMLSHTYGENWRVPDPSFKYETPRWLKRRIMGWFGGLNSHRKHWDGFYNKQLGGRPDGGQLVRPVGAGASTPRRRPWSTWAAAATGTVSSSLVSTSATSWASTSPPVRSGWAGVPPGPRSWTPSSRWSTSTTSAPW